jgi:hypothetical protein
MRRSERDHKEIVEARDLLLFWYHRWQGGSVGVPYEVAEATRQFITRNGESVPKVAFQI